MCRRISQWFGKVKLRVKMLLCLMILLIIAFGVTTYSSYTTVNRIMKAEFENLAEISIVQITKNYDSFLYELYRLTNMALSDANFRDVIRTGASTARQETESTRAIFQFLSNIYLYRNDLSTISLYTEDGRCFIQGFTTFVMDYDRDEPIWYNEMIDDPAMYFRVIGIQNVEYTVPRYPGPVEVFTVARRIADINGEVLGVIALNVKSSSLFDIFSSVTGDGNAQLYLQDAAGQILCRTGQDETTAIDADGNLNTDHFVTVTRELDRTGWRVTIAIPKARIFAGAHDALSSFYTLVCVSMICLAVMYIIITIALTKPIDRLSQGMKRVGKGDFSVSVEPVNMDEIGELTVGFNRMTSQIDELMKKTVAMEVKEKESEYLVLQSQINPHFLYNTLEVIRMQCISRHQNDIADVINTLSNLFRLSINRRERFVMLKEELEHVRSYLAIQNFRFDNKYHLIIDVSEELQKYRVFKLMLQPLVENCIFHGLEVQPGDGHIVISAHLENKRIILRIRDDGVGMTSNELSGLRAFLENPDTQPDRRSLGLRTVHERIRLFFGEDCGLQIESREGDGTCITLVMPAFIDESEVKLNG